MKYTKPYLLPTANGYKRVRRRIGKRHAKKDHNLVAPVLLVASIGLCLGLSWSTSVLQSVKAIDIVVSTQTERVEDTDAQVTPTPSPSPNLSEREQILNYIVEVFGDDAHKAIAMLAICENSELDPYATNYNRNGTVDRGVFQINSIHGGEEMFDWKTNIDTAYRIYKSDNNTFYAWTCASKIGQRNYVDALRGN